MRQVRRKTVDPMARPYLLKAKGEGVELSWNRYEAALPQDGFSLLGLSCHDCLQGPCRLNPFRQEETLTICGLGKDELAHKTLAKLVEQNHLKQTVGWLMAQYKAKGQAGEIDGELLKAKAAKWEVNGSPEELSAGLFHKLAKLDLLGESGDTVGAMLESADKQMEKLELVNDLLEVLAGKKASGSLQTGLGTLKAKAVNICFSGASPEVQAFALELAEELKEEALSRGANDGFNLVLAGDMVYPFSSVTNDGSVELAILTGLVDMYFNGKLPARGKNAAKSYHTVVASFVRDKDELKQLFLQAAVAFTQRDNGKAAPSNQLEDAVTGFEFSAEKLKANLAQKTLKGVCILGGGSNVKVTGDEAVTKAVEALAEQDVLCITYGNTAATLAKYGLLKAGSGSKTVAEALGLTEGPAAYCVGGEDQVSSVVRLAKELNGSKVLAVFPELTTARDVQAVLALAKAGVKVVSGVKLPVDGSDSLAAALAEKVSYTGSKEFSLQVAEWLNN